MNERIKTSRKKKKLTLQALADKCGFWKSYIWELEKGVIKSPSVHTLYKVSCALDTTVDFLLTGDEVDKNEKVLLRNYRSLNVDDKVKLHRIANILKG